MFIKRSMILVVLIFMCSFVSTGFADDRFYSQTDFENFLSGYVMSTEDFEDEALVGSDDAGGVGTMNFAPATGVDTFSATSNMNALKLFGNATFNGNQAYGGSKYLYIDSDTETADLYVDFNFTSSLSAFGLYLTDIENGGVISIGGQDYLIDPTPNGGSLFFGVFHNASFSTVRLNMGSSDTAWSVDNVITAPVVPEPISSTLFIVGGATLGFRRFWKKRQTA
jgi:hypothetical protein